MHNWECALDNVCRIACLHFLGSVYKCGFRLFRSMCGIPKVKSEEWRWMSDAHPYGYAQKHISSFDRGKALRRRRSRRSVYLYLVRYTAREWECTAKEVGHRTAKISERPPIGSKCLAGTQSTTNLRTKHTTPNTHQPSILVVWADRKAQPKYIKNNIQKLNVHLRAIRVAYSFSSWPQ